MKTTVAPYQTAAWCVRIECTNGTVVRLTSYPTDLQMSNGTLYKTDYGYQPSAYSASASFSPSAIDLEGIVAVGGVTRDALSSGVFDNARVYVFRCDFLNPVEDYEALASGFFGKTTLSDDQYRIEGMGLIDALNQSSGQTYLPSCSRTFGDAGCQKSLPTITVTAAITSVTSQGVVRLSSLAFAADYFGAGTIEIITGDNAGLKPLEIKSHSADGTITTFEPFYYLPQVGDTAKLIPGCRKRLEDCRDKWNNVVNFFGFTNIPTSSSYQQVGGNR